MLESGTDLCTIKEVKQVERKRATDVHGRPLWRLTKTHLNN